MSEYIPIAVRRDLPWNDKTKWLIRGFGEVCLVGLIGGIIPESNEPMVLGYSHTVLPMDAKDGADTSAFDGRSEMLRGSACDALADGGSVYVLRL